MATGFTGGYTRLQVVTGGYRVLQEGYKRLQMRVTLGSRWITGGYYAGLH